MEAAKVPEIEKSAAGTEQPTLRRGQPCRLSDQKARKLSLRWANGEGTGELAKEFGLSRTGVLNIVKRAIRDGMAA